MQILSDIQPYNNPAKPVYKYRVWFSEDGLKRRYKVFKIKSTALDFINQAKSWNKGLDISSANSGENQGISAPITPPISRSSVIRYQAIERVCLEYKTSLEEILAFYVQHKERKISDITLREAVRMYLKFVKKSEFSEKHKTFVSYVVDRFVTSLNDKKKLLINLKGSDVENWLTNLKKIKITAENACKTTNEPVSATTFNDYYCSLKAMFNWCIKQGWIEKNPMAKIERRKNILDIKFYTVEQCREWLDKADSFSKSNVKFYIAMAMFTGIRKAELLRLRFEDVHVESREIVLSASITKTCQRRIVKIPENLVKYIEKECWEGRKGLIFVEGENAIKCRIKRLSKILSFKTIQNGFRHTGASYYLAKTQNEYETARQMGHSVDILKRHYAGLVRAKDAEAFYML